MLKITYSDSDIVIEQSTISVEAMVVQRTVLALRLGHPMVVQPGWGSFLLPSHLNGVSLLVEAAEHTDTLAVDWCDRDWLEISLRGTWMAETPASEQGVLMAELGQLEDHLVTLWRLSQTWIATPQSIPKAS